MEVISDIPQNEKQKNALLILITDGGNPNAGYMIGNVFREHSYEITLVYAPTWCKSAGTMIAIGADRLLLGPTSQLGPLDAQLLTSQGGRKSAIESLEAFNRMVFEARSALSNHISDVQSKTGQSYKEAAAISTNYVIGILQPIFNKLNPNDLGSDLRALNVGIQYGINLMEKSGNIQFDGVYDLVYSFPSHDFAIDRHKAKKLFKNVDNPIDALQLLVKKLGWDKYNNVISDIKQVRVLSLNQLCNIESIVDQETETKEGENDETNEHSSEPNE